MTAPLAPLSSVLPPLVLGTATFNHQYNPDPLSLPSTSIVHHALLSGVRAFDTSPYYGPAESLLGQALQSQSYVPRSDYFLSTKCGRISSSEFDYSPSWIRKSIARSLQRLGTDYIDIVFCHDVEFVDATQVLIAVQTLRELRAQGRVRYVGISGYPTQVLVSLSQKIKSETGEPLDAVMSYANYTLQNTLLQSRALPELVSARAGVECVLNGSPLGMGLLRTQGVPEGSMGDFHPAPGGLRERVKVAARKCIESGAKLEMLALRFAIEGWAKEGSSAGTRVKPLLVLPDGRLRNAAIPSLKKKRNTSNHPNNNISSNNNKLGVSVAGVSYMNELELLLELWNDVVVTLERETLVEEVRDVFLSGGGVDADGEDGLRRNWMDFAWASPGKELATANTGGAVEGSSRL